MDGLHFIGLHFVVGKNTIPIIASFASAGSQLPFFSFVELLNLRERTVVTLIVLGADPGALTDPTPEFPTGRTASDLASTNNHKGIGGFLAESSLTNHLSMLKLKESEGNDVSEISGLSSIDDVVAESVAHLADGEEHAAVSMKDCLSALRNSALAAAQIHQVFRVQSFQRKKLVEFGDDKCGTSHERVISLLSLKPSRLGQQDLPLNAAAIKIQNKFRGWKDRKEFMVIRKRIVIIQVYMIILFFLLASVILFAQSFYSFLLSCLSDCPGTYSCKYNNFC